MAKLICELQSRLSGTKGQSSSGNQKKNTRGERFTMLFATVLKDFFYFFYSFGFVGLFLVLRSCTVPADLSTYACPSYIVITQCDLSYEAGDCIGLKTHE